MEALMLLVDICAMFLLVRWSAKSGALQNGKNGADKPAGDRPAGS